MSGAVVVEPAELTQVVTTLTGGQPGAWRLDKIHEGVPSATIGIWRVEGDGWSVILKLIGPGARGHPHWQAGAQPSHWYYWRREVDAYESGLVSSFDGPLRAPHCHLVAARDDGTVALYLEDLRAAVPGSAWTLDQYEVAARHLGEAQGAYVAARPLPHNPWLSRHWLRSYVSRRDGEMALVADPAAWRTPLARTWLSPADADALAVMRGDQDRLLEALDGLPPTVSHLDLHPANLFAAGAATVLVDWSFVGIGALGEDVGNLVPDAALDFHVDADDLDELFTVVHRGYAHGVAVHAPSVPAQELELAMRATIAAKYAWIAPAMLRVALEGGDTLNGRPVDEAFARWAPVVSFLLRCGGEARRLLDAGA